MKVVKKLNFDSDDFSHSLYFGQPETPEEYEEMFSLRYEVYKRKGHIESNKYESKLEKDDYDNKEGTFYFIAMFDGKVVGTVRLIQDSVLPTEKYFDFETPEVMKNKNPSEKGELGRLIVAPYIHGQYFPRNLVFLFLIDTLVEFGNQKGIEAGYAFIKTSLEKKMRKLKMPLHVIGNFTVEYPEDGPIYNYFYKQPEDPVVPMYFLTDEYKKYLRKVMDNKLMFTEGEKEVTLKTNLYTRFLKALRII